MPSIVIKTVRKMKYIQFIDGHTIIHCGNAENLTSWKKALRLYKDCLGRTMEGLLVRYRPDIQKFIGITSTAQLNKAMKEFDKKFPSNPKEQKWLERKTERLLHPKPKKQAEKKETKETTTVAS